jgi:hypothetical protein
MARLELGLGAAFLSSFPIVILIPSVQLAAGFILAGLAIAVVHWMAR